jgi:hypothetical protein
VRFFKINFIIAIVLCSKLLLAQDVVLTLVDKNTFSTTQKKYDSTKLTWPDFKAVMPESNAFFATTYSNTSFALSSRSSAKGPVKLKITTHFYFDRSKSNKKIIGQNDYLLAHEQLHFDISWYWYLVFLQELKTVVFDKQKYIAQANEIFKTNQANLRIMQDAYDADSEHSINTAKQNEWTLKVAALLAPLEQKK